MKNRDEAALEDLIENWYFDERTYRYARALGAMVMRFLRSLETQFTDATVHKHLENCKHIGYFECRNMVKARFVPVRFFAPEDVPHEELFIAKVSTSRYAVESYRASWKRLRQFVHQEVAASSPSPTSAPRRKAAAVASAEPTRLKKRPSSVTIRRLTLPPTGRDDAAPTHVQAPGSTSNAATIEHAERYLVERFRHNAQIRQLDEDARARLGSRYKKGYEVRLLAGDDADLELIRSLIERVGLKAARPFRKRDRWVQPLYGKQAVEWFLERRRPDEQNN